MRSLCVTDVTACRSISRPTTHRRVALFFIHSIFYSGPRAFMRAVCALARARLLRFQEKDRRRHHECSVLAGSSFGGDFLRTLYNPRIGLRRQ